MQPEPWETQRPGNGLVALLCPPEQQYARLVPANPTDTKSRQEPLSQAAKQIWARGSRPRAFAPVTPGYGSLQAL